VDSVLKRRQTNYDFGESNLLRLHPNLKYLLTFEITLKGWELKEHYAVNSGVAMTGVQ